MHNTVSRKVLVLALSHVLFLVSLVVISPLYAGVELPQIKLGTGSAMKGTTEVKLFNRAYSEVFRRLGYKLIIEFYPSKRSSNLAGRGQIDGEVNRVYSYNEANPNLIRVDEHFKTHKFVVYTTLPNREFSSWADLDSKKYRIAYRRGVKIVEFGLRPFVKLEDIDTVSKINHGLQMVANGRADLYIGDETLAGPVFDKLNLPKLRNAGVIDSSTTHMFLHKKHKNLVPKVSLALKELKEEGFVQ